MSHFIRFLNSIRRPLGAAFVQNGKVLFRQPYVAGSITGVLFGGFLTFHSEIISYARQYLPQFHVQAARVDDFGDERPKPTNVNFIADVVETVLPSVVFIQRGPERRYGGIQMDAGSGFIIDENGLIVSNAHVVGNSRHVIVTLANGDKLDGTVLATDPIIDLALVSVTPKSQNLPKMIMGSSKDLRTGEWVVALGSPRFLTNSVTAGIVSAKERDLGHVRGIRYIQTDAVITHGNSGGPLVNVNGEAVGINTLKLEAGIGFAVPSDVVRRFVDQALKQLGDSRGKSGDSAGGLKDKIHGLFDFSKKSDEKHVDEKKDPAYHGAGRSSRMYIGIGMLTLSPNILMELRRIRPGQFDSVTNGVFIHSVHFNSPAHMAGLQPYDIITSIDGQSVTTAEDVHKFVDNFSDSKAQTLALVLIRKGRQIKTTVRPEFMRDLR